MSQKCPLYGQECINPSQKPLISILMIYQQRFTPSPELGTEDNKINETQPLLLGSSDPVLPSTNGTILGHARDQSKRVYVK